MDPISSAGLITLTDHEYFGHRIAAPLDVTFTPQSDITAYELARLLVYFHGQPMYEAEWTSLGVMQRHFKRA